MKLPMPLPKLLLPFPDSSSMIHAALKARSLSQCTATVMPQLQLWGIPQTLENMPECGNSAHRIVVDLRCGLSPFMTKCNGWFVYHFFSFKGPSGYKTLL